MSDPQADFPPSAAPPGALDRALALVEFLRIHCPWDAAQTPHSLRRYLLEEAHEVADAIDGGDPEALRDELGDLLLNLAFQVVIAEEAGAFTRDQVAGGLEDKMRRRHPHLYGDGEAIPWEESKARERGIAAHAPAEDPASVLAGLEPTAEPLREAHRLQARVSTVGFDWADPRGAWEKVREEIDEVGAEIAQENRTAMEEEIGDLLFSVVNLARLSGIDAPTALTRANRKFRRRFVALERIARAKGIVVGETDLEVLDQLWGDAKREER